MEDPLTFGITGARGFIGSELTRLLRDLGHRVVPLSRERPAGEGRFIAFTLGQVPEVEQLRGLDVLVHAAYDFRCSDRRATNVDGSVALLEQAKAAGVHRIIFLSSLSAFDGCRSEYGRGKLAVEREAVRLGALVLRLGLVYSEGDGGLAGSLRKLVRSLKVIPLPGAGGQPLYPLAVDELAVALCRLVSEPSAAGRVVSLARSRPLTFREILRDLARQDGKRPILVPFPWQVMWAGLRGLERAGLKLNFRSDSLISLVNQDPNPDLAEARRLGLDSAGGLAGPAGSRGPHARRARQSARSPQPANGEFPAEVR